MRIGLPLEYSKQHTVSLRLSNLECNIKIQNLLKFREYGCIVRF